MKNENFEREFQERLREQLYEHREKRKLSQLDVADMVGTSHSTYQHWESSGKRLTDIYRLLNVFDALDFSTTEIIDVLGLAPLTLSEIQAVYRDEDILKSTRSNGIYSAMRKKYSDMDDLTLEKLLILLSEEHVKRLKSRL